MTSAPTVCNGILPSERENELFAIIDNISLPELILNNSTNQFAAFDWLVNTDPRQVCPENAVDVRQRYILSLLYYSTSGDGWLTCNSPDAQVLAPCTNASRYLSEDSICNWAGNTCNGAGNLRFLSLGKLLEDLFALP